MFVSTNRSYIMVELVFSALKAPISLQNRQYSVMLWQNLMEQTWYTNLQWHIQITESMLYKNSKPMGKLGKVV